jgi:hypothetical protein
VLCIDAMHQTTTVKASPQTPCPYLIRPTNVLKGDKYKRETVLPSTMSKFIITTIYFNQSNQLKPSTPPTQPP